MNDETPMIVRVILFPVVIAWALFHIFTLGLFLGGLDKK